MCAGISRRGLYLLRRAAKTSTEQAAARLKKPLEKVFRLLPTFSAASVTRLFRRSPHPWELADAEERGVIRS